MFKKITQYMFILSFLTLTSCASIKSPLKSTKEARSVDLLMISSENINPDISGQASPIKVDIYQLIDKQKFNSLNYIQLSQSKELLKDDVVDKKEIMMYPDKLHLGKLKLNPEAKYLAMVAGFRHIDNSKWKHIFIRQPLTYEHPFDDYLYLKIDKLDLIQMSKEEMKTELKKYSEKHPKDKRLNKKGKVKQSEFDYSKGIFSKN